VKTKSRKLQLDNRRLRRESRTNKAVLETVEEVNQILGEDPQGEKFLWTKGFPHNLPPELSAKIQNALKKSPKFGDGN